MNFKIKEDISKVIDIAENKWALESPKDPSHGDFAINVAMVMAKELKKNPRELAQEFKQKIEQINYVASVDIAGPGFINIRISNAIVIDFANKISQGFAFEDSHEEKKSKPISLEFCSANPTGPLHVGHVRGSVYGDIMARLLTLNGYKVNKEYYINDAGAQIDTLAYSVYIRCKEALGEEIAIPGDFYPADYIKDAAKKLIDTKGGKVDWEEDKEDIKSFAIEEMMNLIKQDLLSLKVEHNEFVSEKKIRNEGLIEKITEKWQNEDLAYYGTLKKPKKDSNGKDEKQEDEEELFLFRSSKFGDDEDRAIKKKNGDYSYFMPDVAYHQDKINRGYLNIINLFGADHIGYIKRLTAAVKSLVNKPDDVNIHVKVCQLVNFMKNNKPVRMSKRAGNFETTQDVLDEVHVDIIRFIMASTRNDIKMDFDLEKIKEQSKDNPIFYINYCYSRCNSILQKAGELRLTNDKDDVDILNLLQEECEIKLLKKLLEMPKIIQTCLKNYEIHHLTNYLQSVASEFHNWYHEGSKDIAKKAILEDNLKLTAARTLLIKKVMVIIEDGFKVLNIEPIKSM